jgi:hypothetical protein
LASKGNAASIVTSRNKIRDTHMSGIIMKEQKSVGFIGLGNMGHGIASNLLKAGYTTRVYNRTKGKAKDLVEQGAILVNQPSDVIESGGIVFTMLSDDSALREIAEGDENFVKKLHPGGIHVSLSTVSPDTARSLSAHHSQNGVTYLAAPVIGRPDRAAAETLFTPGGSSARCFQRPRDCCGRQRHPGPVSRHCSPAPPRHRSCQLFRIAAAHVDGKPCAHIDRDALSGRPGKLVTFSVSVREPIFQNPFASLPITGVQDFVDHHRLACQERRFQGPIEFAVSAVWLLLASLPPVV